MKIKIWLYKKEWWHKFMLKFVMWLLEKRHGQQAVEYWFWECTPLPCGKPFFNQYMDGIKMAFSKNG